MPRLMATNLSPGWQPNKQCRRNNQCLFINMIDTMSQLESDFGNTYGWSSPPCEETFKRTTVAIRAETKKIILYIKRLACCLHQSMWWQGLWISAWKTALKTQQVHAATRTPINSARVSCTLRFIHWKIVQSTMLYQFVMPWWPVISHRCTKAYVENMYNY